ncbi:tetraacyldisaccharide 4'-kinase [Segnochrobactrum spirostomi]|nr:tetraacyldisaccharide 4'-kinase [Segnochrobactrum spirostomi]
MTRPPRARAAVPVVCIGNFVAGGAGKTPTALLIAGIARELGRRPVFLSRGYGGREAGPLAVDPARHDAADVGDEPLLLAAAAPTVVSRDRPAGAVLASTLGDLIVMDDGFQNPSLAKDLSIVVVDGGFGIGNGRCIPAGPLRAPLPVQLDRADAVLVIGDPAPALAHLDAALTAHRTPRFAGHLVPRDPAHLAGRRVVAFAGIGRPEKFFDSVRKTGAIIAATRPFPDHHAFTEKDAADLLSLCASEAAVPLTTAKDGARLPALPVTGEPAQGQGRPEGIASRPSRRAGAVAVAAREESSGALGRLARMVLILDVALDLGEDAAALTALLSGALARAEQRNQARASS